MNRAVFLDRDGVITREKGYITSPDQLELYAYTLESVQRLKISGWKLIVVSNQSAVARGLITLKELESINRKLADLAPVDAVYCCPHYPDGDSLNPFIIDCDCRKPKPGLILRAAAEHNIDLSVSYMVGDRASDIIAGENAGLTTVLLRTGYGANGLETEARPDYIFADLKEFVDFLLE